MLIEGKEPVHPFLPHKKDLDLLVEALTKSLLIDQNGDDEDLHGSAEVPHPEGVGGVPGGV